MKLIVGLGNPGNRYQSTRHNAGFMVADSMTGQHGGQFRDLPKLDSIVCEVTVDSEHFVIAKPQTFMNLSGQAVQKLMQHYRIKPQDLWVIFDDLDTPFGKLKLRGSGGAGGHQGVSSIIGAIGQNFHRVRFGISLNDRSVEPSEVYVLKPFNNDERVDLEKCLHATARIVTAAATEDPGDTLYTLAS